MTLDISDTLAPNSDQLDAVDLLGGPQTFTISGVRRGKDDQLAGDVAMAIKMNPKSNKPFAVNAELPEGLGLVAEERDVRGLMGKLMSLLLEAFRADARSAGKVARKHVDIADDQLRRAQRPVLPELPFHHHVLVGQLHGGAVGGLAQQDHAVPGHRVVVDHEDPDDAVTRPWGDGRVRHPRIMARSG